MRASFMATEDDITALEAEIRFMFVGMKTVWKEAAQALDPELQPIGYKILVVLVQHGPLRAQSIADILDHDKALVSRQLRVLERLGLVNIQPNPSDARALLVSPTDSAVASLQSHDTPTRVRLREHMKDWSPEDTQRLIQLLAALNS